MFATKCPGQDMRYWTAEDVHEEKCPHCGEIVEFFKTDIRLRCRNCKTRVANPRFNMGCAEWCAHAEMCLGSAAKGINKKSFRTILEEEFARFEIIKPGHKKTLQEMNSKAEDKCRRERIDMLPVIASLSILTLIKLNQLKNPDAYLKQLADEHSLPAEVVEETAAVISSLLSKKILESENPEDFIKNTEKTTERIVSEILLHECLNFAQK